MIAPFGIRPKGTLAARMLPLAAELRRLGYVVRIVAPAYLNPSDAGTSSIVAGVAVEHVPLAAAPAVFHAAETGARLLGAALRWQPDVLHLFKPKGYGGIAALLARRVCPHVPLVVDTDDWEGRGGWNELQPYSRSMKLFFAWQERSLPRIASAVTVASRTLQTQVWGFGVPASRVHYLPNGVPAHPARLPDREAARRQLGLGDEPLVLLYTRFWEYDLRDIVDVLLGLRSRRPAARLLVLGAGEHGQERELDRLARRAGVAEQLRQHGWAERPAIEAAFAACDVALAPFADTLMNRAKGMAKLLELLHAGVPVVASAVGQATEYVRDGQTGLLVAPNGAALARATLALLEDPPRARALGAAARRDVAERYGWPGLAAALAEVYAGLESSRGT